jgi:hypothetical protein
MVTSMTVNHVARRCTVPTTGGQAANVEVAADDEAITARDQTNRSGTTRSVVVTGVVWTAGVTESSRGGR